MPGCGRQDQPKDTRDHLVVMAQAAKPHIEQSAAGMQRIFATFSQAESGTSSLTVSKFDMKTATVLLTGLLYSLSS